MNCVPVTFNDAIGTIVLNHGKVNALSEQLIGDICSALEEMKRLAARVVILRAAKGARSSPLDTT